MTNDIHNTQSTTEELIVAYLDGELVRKELEIELFDRLATGAEARTLLREHLVMRGAIKQSMTDDRFSLSDDLDTRTRARLEQILKNVSTPAVIEAARSKRMADAPAVSHNAAERRLQQWSKRPAMLALLLLLAVGSTWYLTRASIENNGAEVATNNSTKTEQSDPVVTPATPDMAAATQTEQPTATKASTQAEPKVIIRNVVRKVYVDRPSREMAQQNNASQSVQQGQTQHADPTAVMLSRRAGAALKNSNTIVITEQDRI
jgi:hypothetical protein